MKYDMAKIDKMLEDGKKDALSELIMREFIVWMGLTAPIDLIVRMMHETYEYDKRLSEKKALLN
jgi:hypothetical protein